jgi:rhodanese-related sulfurtransferase
MTHKKNKKSANKAFPVWGWVVLVVVALAVIAGVALSQPKPAVVPSPTSISPPQAAYPAEITPAQTAEKRDQGAFILDVREPSEWTQVHIPGATLIPLGELPSRLSEVPMDKDVIVVCHSGNRSAKGRDILRAAGINRATSMAGGMTSWQAQGLPVASGQ